MAAPLLAVRDLAVRFSTPDGPVEAVRGVDLDVFPGETLGIVGESGSGKSQIMNAVMGLLAANGVAGGSISFMGQSLLDLPAREMNRVRGAAIGMIFQEPMTSLDPLYTIGAQMALPLRRHGGLAAAAARDRARELLALVEMPDPEGKLAAYPHQLSGGQRQRVMIAMAIANTPKLLIADEPTTALDVTIQAQILALLADLQKRFGMAIVLISHDLNLVGRHADRVAVMRRGRIEEQGPVAAVFKAPKTVYTRDLLAAEPTGRKEPVAALAPTVLAANGLSVAFPREGRLFARRPPPFVAVDQVSLAVKAGETLGIVGESGSGKSTLGRALLRLQATTGTVTFAGADLTSLAPGEMKALRRDMQMVFQDPFGSLSPRMTVGDIVGEGLLVHEPALSRAERQQRAIEALSAVGIDPASRNRFPHEFSGGQRQRIAIARALVLRPQLILLDEPTSALDRTVQKTVLDLLRALQRQHGLTYLFISHDLKVVRAMADRIIVMKDGRIVEEGTAEAVTAAPREPYTRQLMQAAGLQPQP
mgnify:CR=1 FL=1